MPDLIRVGQIAGAFGLRGHVKVQPLTDFWERFQEGRELYLNGKPIKIETSTTHKGRPLLKLEGIDSATQAEALQFAFLEGFADEEFALDEDEYYTAELLGLQVVTVDGRDLGEVDEVHRYPAHDVIEVNGIMIPAVKQFIKDVDLTEGRMTVELIEGMEDPL